MQASPQTDDKTDNYYEKNIRSSSKFLNMQILRLTLSNSPIKANYNNVNQSFYVIRTSNANAIKPKQTQQFKTKQQSYARLKDTLKGLQNKINQAQQVLGNTGVKKQNKNMNQIDLSGQNSDVDERKTKQYQYHQNYLSGNQKQKNKNEESVKTCKIVKIPQIEQIKTIKYNKQYYISSLLKINNQKCDPRVREHINLSFQIFHKFSKVEAPSIKQISQYKLNLATNKRERKTLLLDIDDTILYCDDQNIVTTKYDFELTIPGQSGQSFLVYIKLRPYVLTFLKNISKIYQIIAYTGSVQKYVNRVLDQIDPDGQIFSYRLYRDNCFQICNGIYVKDIRILNRRPQNIVLVDNSPYSYIYQLQNGIPILPYQSGSDEELLKLEKYLIMLNKCTDIRQVNKNIFKFHKYKQYPNVDSMIEDLYANDSNLYL